jgi:hypothetical protein
MTTKTDYTDQEWEGLLQAPLMAGFYIIMADISVTGMGKELKGLYQAVLAQQAPEAAQELVAAVTADIVARSQQKGALEQPKLEENQEPRPQILNAIQQDLAVLDEKSTPEEKAGYSAWLVNVAQATAEAGREGGFLGIGSVRVSEQEKTALAGLQQALGLA